MCSVLFILWEIRKYFITISSPILKELGFSVNIFGILIGIISIQNGQ